LLVSQKTGYTTPPSPDFNLLAGNIQRRNINLSGPCVCNLISQRSNMNSERALSPKNEWDLIIRPRRSWWDLRLGELWRYRDLIWMLVWRDFVSQYKQTILGPLWYVIQPVATTVVFTVIFGNIAHLSTDGLPPFLFYLAGTTVWSFFSGCLMSTSNTFTSNASIFGKSTSRA